MLTASSLDRMNFLSSLSSTVQQLLVPSVSEDALAALRQRRWGDALSLLERDRLRLGTDHAELAAHLGKCYYQLGRYQVCRL